VTSLLGKPVVPFAMGSCCVMDRLVVVYFRPVVQCFLLDLGAATFSGLVRRVLGELLFL